MIDIKPVAESFVSSLLAAAAVAVLAYVYSRLRNWQLEQSLVDALTPNGIGTSYDPRTNLAEFTLQIHNYANATIRVRSIIFKADKSHIELRPSKRHSLYQTPMSNEAAAPKFRRKLLSERSLSEDGNPHAMLLPPKTMGIWEVDPHLLGQREWKVVTVFLIFEYATLFGNVALVRIEAKPIFTKSIKENLEPLSSALFRKDPAAALALFQIPRNGA